MSGFKLGNISLGKATKKYTRNTDFDNNTTMDFGFCQPLFCQFMLPDSDVSVSAKQLVRLAPMPVPSFARVSLVNKYIFVPFADVCPYYEAMLANMPYNGSVIPKTLPYVYNSNLSRYLLSAEVGTVCTIYHKENSSSIEPVIYKKATISEIVALSDDLGIFLSENSVDTSIQLHFTVTPIQGDASVDINNADYVLEITLNNKPCLVSFRYSTLAKHLRTIFLGLGYSLALNDNNKVNALPLFAYYKAWFDTYAPLRTSAWTDTTVFAFIKHYSDIYEPNVVNMSFFTDVIQELGNTYYVSNDDFVSVHRANLSNLNDVGSPSFVDSNGLINSLSTSDGNLPTLSALQKLSLIKFQTIQRLTRFVNKDSIIGQKMSNWVRNHFNAQVANSLYKDVYQIKTDILPLQINDVFSTSDTADASTKQGERLGAYAGKGIGFGDSGCKFHADKHGYLLCLSCIVPKSGYFQGSDSSLYGLDRYTLPSADFDALGMEISPFGFVAGDNGYCDTINSDNIVDYTSGFGFVPRYSGFKFKKNIVNGDMSRRSTIDSMCPYYLDRILQNGDIFTNKNADQSFTLVRSFSPSVPKASEQWRYLTRYPWLGDFDRIFYNDDVYHGSSAYVPFLKPDFFNARPDNFIVQSLFTMKISDVLKPLAMSYDTYEESTDNGSQDVKPE